MGTTATKGGETDLTKNQVSWDIGRCEGTFRGKGEAKAVSFVGGCLRAPVEIGCVDRGNHVEAGESERMGGWFGGKLD